MTTPNAFQQRSLYRRIAALPVHAARRDAALRELAAAEGFVDRLARLCLSFGSLAGELRPGAARHRLGPPRLR